MLFEDDVVEAVSAYLESRGYRIKQRRKSSQRGHDIIAVKSDTPAVELHIEAKGATSNRAGSGRHGKSFNSAQVRDHVANAFYCAAAMLNGSESAAHCLVGVAFPDDPLHRRYVMRIQSALQVLQVAVFWVAHDRKVRAESSWPI